MALAYGEGLANLRHAAHCAQISAALLGHLFDADQGVRMHEAYSDLILCTVVGLLLLEGLNRLDEPRVDLIEFVLVLSLG